MGFAVRIFRYPERRESCWLQCFAGPRVEWVGPQDRASMTNLMNELTIAHRARGRAPQGGGSTTVVGASRRRLLDLSVGLVEDLRCDDGHRDERYCPVFQVCLPYRGIFVWHVGGDDVIGDPNQVVFVTGGEAYRMSAPVPGGYAELVITPPLHVLGDILGANESRVVGHPRFRRRRASVHPRFQLLRTRFLHRATSGAVIDELEAEELVLALVRLAFSDEGPRDGDCSASTGRLIRRTKALLEAELSNRILLADVGRAVGASPAYLTDVFRRVEGVSLHQYLTQLRLARALVDLPHANDLTALALNTGFSSHSHFSAAFRRSFGCTPSDYRETARGTSPPCPA